MGDGTAAAAGAAVVTGGDGVEVRMGTKGGGGAADLFGTAGLRDEPVDEDFVLPDGDVVTVGGREGWNPPPSENGRIPAAAAAAAET